MRSSSSRRGRTSCPQARRSATCGSLEVARRTQADREAEQMADQHPDGAAGRPLARARVRGVAARRDRRQLSGRGQPGEPDEDGGERDVTDRDKLEDVKARVETKGGA